MNKTLPQALTALLLILSVAEATAQVEVSQPWVRATVAQQKATGAFFQLKAKTDARLVEVRSSVAGVAEVHEMAMDGAVMKMRAVPSLALPAGQTVELKPGGYHVMLMDLKAPIKAGDSVPLTLVFEGADKKRETLEIKAEARQLGSPAAPTMAH
ncbi:copper chaperone PCu(A)C [Paucibacter sp. B2R-40]|uniref:copper chaperone PCu(A)C n=1 Tax=Paucibacter sp. B2R-40 TaxID=2893554 RepID=UPI0021E4A3B4|nr:copper chaperone PCu(A)C [Paucibacter sp. B2R-40]MCV2353408.1 copper chaperone PCu(A)C [Paucibacter sp. B2R-40]